jgi:uncharacterized protein (TIGR02145 family)
MLISFSRLQMLAAACLMLAHHAVLAQGTSINPDGSPPHPSSMLDVSGTGKGVLINRMTTAERDAIEDPAVGLQVFNLTTGCFDYFYNDRWYSICGTCPAPDAPAAAVHTSTMSTITWNWNTVADADGYKWNIADNYATATDNGTSTTFTQTGLSASSAYMLYVWAYNDCGTSDAAVFSQNTSAFVCGSSITDARDSQSYPTVLIGSQCWLAKNMNYDATIGSDWCYNNVSGNCAEYGRLYDWNSAMQGAGSSSASPSGVQGVCPSGWHLPSRDEWLTLQATLGGESVAGGPLKESGFTHWNSPNTGATNTSGFTAVGGGHYSASGGSFFNLNIKGNFWTATQFDGSNGWATQLANDQQSIYWMASNKSFGFSVRCVKN